MNKLNYQQHSVLKFARGTEDVKEITLKELEP